MRINKYFTMAFMGAMALGLSSCQNGDPVFDDYEGGTTVYFARQNVVRNVVLGNDETRDNTDDNNHVFYIVSTMGGAYQGRDITMNLMVDNSLCDNLYFDEAGNNPVKPMPSSYYTIPSTTVSYDGGFQGRMQVKLEDAFFADPLSTKLTYVIPVKMKKVTGADSILCGKPQDGVLEPIRLKQDDWQVLPKDYVLYAIKYISPYQSNYLRRGVDSYSGAKIGIVRRHEAYVEKDEVLQNQFTTFGINVVEWNRVTKNQAGENIDGRLKLSFDAEGKCVITSNSPEVAATGTGQFVPDGDKKSWGGEDRDVLYLDYTLNYDGIQCATKDTLVVRDRGVAPEWFKVEAK